MLSDAGFEKNLDLDFPVVYPIYFFGIKRNYKCIFICKSNECEIKKSIL